MAAKYGDGMLHRKEHERHLVRKIVVPILARHRLNRPKHAVRRIVEENIEITVGRPREFDPTLDVSEIISPPLARASATVSSLAARSVSQPTTLAPSARKRNAAARPIPFPVPVISAVLPASRFMWVTHFALGVGGERFRVISGAFKAEP
jgi:hypothetical protein